MMPPIVTHAPFAGHLLYIPDYVDRRTFLEAFAACKAAGEFDTSTRVVQLGHGWMITNLSTEDIEDLGARLENVQPT